MGAKRSKYADCDFKGWATSLVSFALMEELFSMVLLMILMALKFH